jgi:hypothetical protein
VRLCRFTMSHHPERGRAPLPLVVGKRVSRNKPLSVAQKMQAIQALFPGKRVFYSWEKPRDVAVNNFAAFIGSYRDGKYAGRIHSWHRFYVEA